MPLDNHAVFLHRPIVSAIFDLTVGYEVKHWFWSELLLTILWQQFCLKTVGAYKIVGN